MHGAQVLEANRLNVGQLLRAEEARDGVLVVRIVVIVTGFVHLQPLLLVVGAVAVRDI